MKIAITGGIGSGKSTVAKIIKDMGYPVFSCDEIYKNIFESAGFIEQIRKSFPVAIKNEKIDKAELAKVVFSNREKREQLNRLSHPMIMELLNKEMDKCTNEFIFAEVPLLFEGNFEDQFDKIIVVKRAFKERLTALQKRDGLNVGEILERINAQVDYDSEKMQARLQGDNILLIENSNSSLEDLKEKIYRIIQSLLLV